VSDLAAYLERIGLGEGADLADVHRAHAVSIPFEGLDPYVGLPVSLEPGAIAEKLVIRRRGGYCFEQNLLLSAALEALGFEVELFLARVVLGAQRFDLHGFSARPDGRLSGPALGSSDG
jgi:N-hydroxyarylamine O-acetyltransferase